MAIFEKKFKLGVQINGGETFYRYVKSLNPVNYLGSNKWELDGEGGKESEIIANSLKVSRTPDDNETISCAIYVGSEAGTFEWSATQIMLGAYFTNVPSITWTNGNNMTGSPYIQNYSADYDIYDDYPYVEDWMNSAICPYGIDNLDMRICVFYWDGKFSVGFLSRQSFDYRPDTRGGWFIFNDSWSNFPTKVDITQYDVPTIEYPDLDPEEPPDDDPKGGDGDGDGSSDPVDFPDGIDVSSLIANAHLFNVYHVSTATLQLLNDYLWTTNWIDNIKKGFDSPMQCIAGLHILPISLLGTSAHISVGGLDTEISSEHITSYRKTIDIGSLTLNEYWGNFLDYDHTTVKLYLPFVGFQLLETKKVMGATLTIRYVIDVITGDFQCFVKRTKNGNTHVIYTFSGNMAMSLPLSQATNTSIMGSVLGLTSGAMMSAVTGNPMPLVGSAVSTVGSAMAQSATSEQRSIVHNGSYGGSKGYMGEMTPYVIIERPTQQIPSNYNRFVGVPSYFKATLNSVSGFTKVQEIHLNCSASAEERADIERMLKAGVIL